MQFRAFQNSLPTLSPWKRLTIVTLNHGKEDMAPCPYCNLNECHPWLATQGLSTLLHFPINPIHHIEHNFGNPIPTHILSRTK
ncbi:hypothetical protein NPIL_478961 [Nephila pilipes]|uniref:Uncharacterized protein n=1 Tax=Nephila pilipes TaxID=299642 RepID=A0A8X6UDB1_NEPPI|nr:hypothetical protein NPIL_478961 [Nephila pilipes]